MTVFSKTWGDEGFLLGALLSFIDLQPNISMFEANTNYNGKIKTASDRMELRYNSRQMEYDLPDITLDAIKALENGMYAPVERMKAIAEKMAPDKK
ncbi:hypothetical protein [Pseudochelatococcus sp. G4_1912]|uniref:hypothetical protein n=1 Tax=Pseudochelatococcus sp. G4_1912 TaxID=3114288 RepID=UPI0039C741D4